MGAVSVADMPPFCDEDFEASFDGFKKRHFSRSVLWNSWKVEELSSLTVQNFNSRGFGFAWQDSKNGKWVR